MPNCSPVARADGTTEAPGCDSEGACESSVSSEWASMALANAASIAPQTTSHAATVAVFSAECARANWIANRPGASSAPETMAANVSRICCFVFSTASSGRARCPASLIYELSRIITGLGDVPAAKRGTAAPAAMKERLVMLFDLISKNDPAFHHEFYPLHFSDV